MKVLDLFSGIGGFSLGLERAGMETVAFCEIEPYARKVLAKHWPDVPIHDDVRELDGTQYRGTVDLICGGYPCQPFSTAGKRQGKTDDRHLWPEMYRIIRECQPAWVIAENVAGHISMGIDEVLSDLESEGYTCWPFVIPACALNADHRRDRVWIVANASGRRFGGESQGKVQLPGRAEVVGSGETLPHPEIKNDGGCNSTEGERQKLELGGGAGARILADSDSDSGKRLKSGQSDAQERSIKNQQSIGSCCDGAAWWPPEPGVGRVADGIPNRAHRVRGLGNAVVPLIPEIIGVAIQSIESKTFR